jgi:L-malate glycosyltransferase
MRIVHLVETLDVGGAERMVVALANCEAPRHDLIVACALRAGRLAQQLDRRVAVRELGKTGRLGMRAIGRLSRVLREQRTDVLHIHHWGVFLDGVLAARLAGVRTVLHTAHGRYPAYGSGAWSRCKLRARHWLEARAAAHCRAIVCVSEALVAPLRSEIGLRGARLEVIENGVAMQNEASRPDRPKADSSAGRFVLVAVGRLEVVKNLSMLLCSLSLARERCSDLELIIVGDGAERSQLQQCTVNLGLTGCVKFLGWRSDVDSILQAGDAFVLSSVSEGIPLSMLEAMRARLPVVATAVGGVPRVVEHGVTGLLVASGDAVAMAGALVALASDRFRARQMGEAGWDRVARMFSLEHAARAYESLYRSGATGRAT